MTLMKSILLGSAAGIVAVASAQAADLPTKKAAPAEYVKICNVGGMAGFIIPGSDTCLKISGYISAQMEAGNADQAGYLWTSHATQGKGLTSSAADLRPSFGYTTRGNFDFDARTMTSYGVLRGYAEIQIDQGQGFDPTYGGTLAYMNLAYVQWAGITAGKAPSFFSFFGGGEAYANIFSPDQQGFNQPSQIAYTATFGGGFSATIAAQSSGAEPDSDPFGTNFAINNYVTGVQNTTYYGMTAPDIVANVRVDQSWGAAQVSGVLHQVHDYATDMPAYSQNKWGWGIDGGVKFNLPTLGVGDLIQVQGVYTQNAFWFSGINDGMWGENGAVNGNGLAMSAGDNYFAGLNAAGAAVWATPTAWSIGGTMEHHFSPQFSFDPEASYAQLNWSNSLGQLSSNSQSWIVGAAAHWDPVALLDFEVELLYQTTHMSTPGLWTSTGGTINGVASAFPNNPNGFAGRFMITRSF
jgi:hypothetical protein